MYERHHQPMLSRRKFLLRLLGHALVAVIIVGGSLLLGVWGFMTFCELTAIDALLNATMLFGGMGQWGNRHRADAGKLFASFYALYAGLVFLILAGALFAPLLHRFLHHFHLEMVDVDAQPRRSQAGHNRRRPAREVRRCSAA